MPDIDSLNIEIRGTTKAATDAIKDLISSLASLNNALNNYADGSDYIKGLNRLSTGLESISNAVSGADVENIKTLASAIGTLSTKGRNLSQLNIVKAFNGMGAAAQGATEQTKQAVKDLSETFGVSSKKGIEELTATVGKFYASMDNDEELNNAAEQIRDIIKEYADLGDTVDDTYSKVRNWVSNTSFALPKGATQEFIDDFKRMRGVLGISNTTTDFSKGMGLDTVIPEMNQALGTSFNSDNIQDGLRELVDYLEQGRDAMTQFEEQEREAMASSDAMASALDRLYTSIGKVREVSSQIPDGVGFDIDLESIQAEAPKVENAFNTIQREAQETQSIENPFEGIVRGVESLQGISITTEQFGGLKTINSFINKLAGDYTQTAITTLPQIADGLSRLQGIQIPNFGDEIFNLAAGLKQLGGAAMTRAQGFPKLVDGLIRLQDVKIPHLEGLSEFTAAISRLGYKGATQAIQNIPDLAMSFNYLMTTLSKAPKVSEETIRLAEAMAQLATASRQVGTSTQQSGNGIKSFASAMKSVLPHFNRTRKSAFSLASMFGKLYASYFLLIRGIRGLGSAITEASNLTEVGNVVATVFGQDREAIDDFAANARDKFGMVELSAYQFASRFQAMGTAMGITNEQVAKANEFLVTKLEGTKREVEGVEDSYADLGNSMADLSVNLTKLTADYASLYNVDYDEVAEDMAAIMTGMTKPLRTYGLDLTQATLKEFALKNGLDADIESMTQAEKTMLRYQYVMANSGRVMNDFAITADNWANVIRTIGQQFIKLKTIIGTGLINTFKPLLIGFRNFMNTFLSLTEKALNAIGKLLGWQVEFQEVGVTMDDSMSDYADNLEDAADSAKKLNSQLRSIDELNNLTTSKGKSGSGDDGILGDLMGATGGGMKFTEVPKAFESDIDSWGELGERIRDKVISGFKAISWADLSEKVKLNAKGLSDFIVGLLKEDENGDTLGGEVGSFLANALNLGFDWLVTFTSNKNMWKEAGGNVADFISNFFDDFDAKDAADTIDNIVQGLLTILTTAAGKLSTPENRKKIANKIGEFIKSIDPATWRIALSGLGIYLGSLAIKGVTKWVISDLLKTQLEQALVSKLSTDGVAATAAEGVGIVLAISLLIDDITMTKDAADKAREIHETYDLLEYDENGAVGVKDNPKEWVEGIKEQGWSGFFRMITDGFKIMAGLPDSTTAYQLKDNSTFEDLEKYGAMLKEMESLDVGKGTREELEKYNEQLDLIAEKYGLSREAALEFQKVVEDTPTEKYWASDFWSQIGDEFFGEGSLLYESFVRPFKKTGEDAGKTYINGMEVTLIDQADTINSDMEHTGGGAGRSFADGMDKGFNFNYWWENSVMPWFTVEKWQTLGNNVKLALTTKWEEFSTWWKNTGIYKWWTENVQPWFTKEKWSTLGENMKKGLSEKWDSFKKWWQESAIVKWFEEDVKPWFTKEKWEETFQPILDAIHNIWDRVKKVFDEKIDVKLPHFKWSEGENSAPDWAAKILETLGLPTSIPKLNVEWYAQGGYPSTGSLFYAGEAGAELIGSVNGKTTVASNGEITGISDTIRSTSAEEIALLRQQNQLLQGILQKEFGISKNDIYKSVRQSDKEFRGITGRSGFAY